MILNVKNRTHGFGDRAIFDNLSFRLCALATWNSTLLLRRA